MYFKILAFITLLFISTSIVFAKEFLTQDELKSFGFNGYESTNTDSPNYLFKRISEELKFRFLLKNKQSKAKYLSQLLEKRLKEVVYMVNNNQLGVFENTTNRYDTFAGRILGEFKDLDPNLKKQARNYIRILERMRDVHPANSSYWLMMQQTIDTTKRLE